MLKHYTKALSFKGSFTLMITIIKKKTGKKTTFKNIQACYKHIRSTQSNKHVNFLINPLDTWVFTRHSMRRILAFQQYACQQLKKNQQNPSQKLLKLDALEICLDRSQKPLLIPITPDMDLHGLLQDWCRVYFQSHGYEFLDVPGDNSF
jgi:hypothetical protein